MTNKIVVCGAGAAGMAAALAAARMGSEVSLIEAKPRPGGTVAHALIHTLGGLFDSAGEFIVEGLARELAERLARADRTVHRRKLGRAFVLNVIPDRYQIVVQQWLEEEPRISVRYNTRVASLSSADGRVGAAEFSGPQGHWSSPVDAVIDATGTAEIVGLIDPALVLLDPLGAGGGLIFRLRGVAPGTVTFPKGVGVLQALRSAAAEGRLPAECGKAWLDSGSLDDEVYVKLFVPRQEGRSSAEIMEAALDVKAAVVAFLKQLTGFEQAQVVQTGELGVRDSSRIRGEYCLSGEDVRAGRRFPDAACRCCWPIEYWHPYSGVSMEYLPDGSYYEIPMRSLKVAGVDNVWAAGKILSADRYAQASARVVGSCWGMGEAAGKAAAALV